MTSTFSTRLLTFVIILAIHLMTLVSPVQYNVRFSTKSFHRRAIYSNMYIRFCHLVHIFSLHRLRTFRGRNGLGAINFAVHPPRKCEAAKDSPRRSLGRSVGGDWGGSVGEWLKGARMRRGPSSPTSTTATARNGVVQKRSNKKMNITGTNRGGHCALE